MTRFATGLATIVILLLASGAGADRLIGQNRGPFMMTLAVNEAEDAIRTPYLPPGVGRSSCFPPSFDMRRVWTRYWERNREHLLAHHGKRNALAPWGSSWVLGRGRKTVGGTRPVRRRDVVETILPAVRGALTDGNAYVRDAAVIALGRIGGEEVVPLLISRTREETDPQVRQDAVLALGMAGRIAVPYLSEILRSGARSDDLRSYAAFAIALSGWTNRSGALIEMLGRHREIPDIAAAAALALGALRNRDAVTALSRIIGDRDASRVVHACAATALGKIGSPDALRALTWHWKRLDVASRGAGALALGSHRDVRIGLFLATDGLKGVDGVVRDHAAIGAARILPRSMHPYGQYAAKVVDLRRRLAHPNRHDRSVRYLALGLSLAGDKTILPDLREIVPARKFKDTTRSCHALCLGLLGDVASRPALLEILANRGNAPEFRSYAALALGLIGRPGDAKLLRERYAMARAKTRPRIGRGCVQGLGFVGGAEDIEFLVEVLTESRDAAVRSAAAMALRRIGDVRAVPLLVEIAQNQDGTPVDRAFALVALGHLADRAPYPVTCRVFANFTPWVTLRSIDALMLIP
jgi:HEAT repeat protein